MTDIRIKENFSLEGVTMDWLLRDTGELDEREELATAVRVALGTDSMAAADDILPDPDSTDRRGWWGDLEAAEIWGGWPIGCKNWLLSRAKITQAPSSEGATLTRANQYTSNALQPFVDKRMASQFTVDAQQTELNRIVVSVKIYRGPLAEIDLLYQLLWQEDEIFEAAEVPIASTQIHIRVPYANLTLSPTGLLGNLTVHPFFKTDWPNPRGRKVFMFTQRHIAKTLGY